MKEGVFPDFPSKKLQSKGAGQSVSCHPSQLSTVQVFCVPARSDLGLVDEGWDVSWHGNWRLVEENTFDKTSMNPPGWAHTSYKWNYNPYK